MNVSDIKRKQRESLIYKTVTEFFHKTLITGHPELSNVVLTHAELSRDKGLCTIYFYTDNEEAVASFTRLLNTFTGKTRKALADSINGRYVPEVRYMYDAQYKKQLRIEEIFLKIQTDTPESDE